MSKTRLESVYPKLKAGGGWWLSFLISAINFLHTVVLRSTNNVKFV